MRRNRCRDYQQFRPNPPAPKPSNCSRPCRRNSRSRLGFSGALSGGILPAKLREEIALAVGEENECQYCVSAHTAIGKLAGLTDTEIGEAREARSSSPKHPAALEFARQVVAKRGRVTDADFEAIRMAGFGDGEVAEIIAHVALNVFTNYFNNVAEVEVDFPKIALRKTA